MLRPYYSPVKVVLLAEFVKSGYVRTRIDNSQNLRDMIPDLETETCHIDSGRFFTIFSL
jgi:hypothetical protein